MGPILNMILLHPIFRECILAQSIFCLQNIIFSFIFTLFDHDPTNHNINTDDKYKKKVFYTFPSCLFSYFRFDWISSCFIGTWTKILFFFFCHCKKMRIIANEGYKTKYDVLVNECEKVLSFSKLFMFQTHSVLFFI